MFFLPIQKLYASVKIIYILHVMQVNKLLAYVSHTSLDKQIFFKSSVLLTAVNVKEEFKFLGNKNIMLV